MGKYYNGAVLGTTPSVTLNPNIASAGDIIACTATATDIDGAFVAQTQRVAVRNGSPLISDVEITGKARALEIISESTRSVRLPLLTQMGIFWLNTNGLIFTTD